MTNLNLSSESIKRMFRSNGSCNCGSGFLYNECSCQLDDGLLAVYVFTEDNKNIIICEDTSVGMETLIRLAIKRGLVVEGQQYWNKIKDNFSVFSNGRLSFGYTSVRGYECDTFDVKY